MKAVDLITKLETLNSFHQMGKLTRVIGLLVESVGPPASIGELCRIHIPDGSPPVLAEVVGFHDNKVLLMPYSALTKISPGSLVESTGKPFEIKVGEALIGSVVNSLGEPLNGVTIPPGLKQVPIDQEPPNPLERPRILEPISMGVRSIDGLLTVGLGQRIGIFAGSGVGKSTLLGMVARQSSADLNVIALVGERGREVREFIERELGPEGIQKSIVVVATSDQPALMRIKAAMTATAIAEFFRDKGKNVLLMMDSVTRVAMAQRELGLAIGEPPTTKGYPPSVFAILPKLLERAGSAKVGTITGIYTVLVDGDDMDEPIADAVRGILDGHIVLDRRLAERGQYPAINILKSISRVMTQVTTPEHRSAAVHLRSKLSQYLEVEDLIQIGAYKQGSSESVDSAIRDYPDVLAYLKQHEHEKVDRLEAIQALEDRFKPN